MYSPVEEQFLKKLIEDTNGPFVEDSKAMEIAASLAIKDYRRARAIIGIFVQNGLLDGELNICGQYMGISARPEAFHYFEEKKALAAEKRSDRRHNWLVAGFGMLGGAVLGFLASLAYDILTKTPMSPP